SFIYIPNLSTSFNSLSFSLSLALSTTVVCFLSKRERGKENSSNNGRCLYQHVQEVERILEEERLREVNWVDWPEAEDGSGAAGFRPGKITVLADQDHAQAPRPESAFA
ncbi:hypothetical protein F2P56_024918, partial [Juglans regia]